jgi:PAS domain S-box-containing protein
MGPGEMTPSRRPDELFRLVVEAAPTGMVLIDRAGRMILSNAQAETLFGYRREELLGQPVELLVPQRFRGRHPENRASFFEAPQTRSIGAGRDLYGLRKDGSEVPVEIGLTPLHTDTGTFVLAAIIDVSERRRAQRDLRRAHDELELRVQERTAELRASNEHMDLALSSAGVGTWDWRIGEDVVTWDRYMHPLFGLRPGTFPGTYEAFLEMVAPDDRERADQEVRRSVHGDEEYDSEYRVVWPDRTVHVVGARGKVYRDEAGRPLRMTGVCWDMTQRRRTEEELRRTAASLDRVAAELALPRRDQVATGQTFRISQFLLTDMIACGAVIRGMSVGRRDVRELAEDVARFLYTHFLDDAGCRAFALVRLFETRFLHQLDAELQAVAATFPGTRPQTVCLTLVATAGDEPAWNDPRQSAGHRAIPLVSAVAVDRLPMITQLLRQLGLDVAGVVAPSEDVVLSSSTTGVFHVEEARGSPWIPAQETFVIPRGLRSVVGFGDLLSDGRLFVVIAFSKAPVSREVARLLSHLSLSLKMALQPLLESPRRTEAQILALDKLLRNYEAVVAEQEGALRRQARELARSNAELEQFAYVASHDLQEPLRKVQAFGDMLVSACGAALSEEGQDYLRRMQNAARRMQLLINDLLIFSRVTSQAKPYVEVDLARTAREVLSDLEARLRDTQGRVEVGELPRLDADPLQMQQLLQNLIGNALKFHRPNEPPLVQVQGRVLRGGAAGGAPPDEVCEITVRDNGIGFDEKYRDRIFAPFQRLHGRGEYEGTGMGLAICRKIVERHGGTIAAGSAPGQGATFVVLLPRRQREAEQRHA